MEKRPVHSQQEEGARLPEGVEGEGVGEGEEGARQIRWVGVGEEEEEEGVVVVQASLTSVSNYL